AVLAVFLRPVERAVGEPNELVAPMSLHGERRKTRADGDVSDVIEIELGDALDDRGGGRERHPLVVVGEQEREFVAAEPECLAPLAQPSSDLRENAVPGRMSEAVVD